MTDARVKSEKSRGGRKLSHPPLRSRLALGFTVPQFPSLARC